MSAEAPGILSAHNIVQNQKRENIFFTFLSSFDSKQNVLEVLNTLSPGVGILARLYQNKRLEIGLCGISSLYPGW